MYGAGAEQKGLPHPLGRSGRRKGRLRAFHVQGDHGAARRRQGDDSPAHLRRQDRFRGARRHDGRGAPRRAQDSRDGLRLGLLRRLRRKIRLRAALRPSRPARARERAQVLRPAHRRNDARHRHLPVGRDGGHHRRAQGGEGPRREDARRRQRRRQHGRQARGLYGLYVGRSRDSRRDDEGLYDSDGDAQYARRLLRRPPRQNRGPVEVRRRDAGAPAPHPAGDRPQPLHPRAREEVPR